MLKDLKSIWKILKPFHGLFIFFFFLKITIAGLDALYSIIQGHLIQGITSYNIESFKFWIILFIVLNITYYGLDYLHDYQYVKRIKRKIFQYLQEYSLSKLFSFNVSQTLENNSAIRQDITNRGEESIVNTTRLIGRIVFIVSFLIFTIGTVFYYSVIFGIFNLTVFIIILSWGLWFNKYYKPIREKVNDVWLTQRKIKQEAYTHVSLIKSLGQENTFLNKYLRDRSSKVEYSIDKDLISERHDGRRNYFLGSVYISVYFLLAYIFINRGLPIAAAYIISTNMLMSIHWTKSLYEVISELILEHVNVQKYLHFINLEADFNENGKDIDFKNGDIIFKDFSFAYPKKEQFIKEIDINSPDGESDTEIPPEGSNIENKERVEDRRVLDDINLTIKKWLL